MKSMNDQLSELGMKLDVQETLKKNYQEAQKNPLFQKLIKEIPLPEEELMKYTSLLEKSMVEYEHCSTCPGLISCQNQLTGYSYLPNVNNKQIIFEYKACRYEQQRQKQTAHEKNMMLLEVPKEIREAKMKEIYTKDKKRYETIKWIKQFITTYKNEPHQKGLFLSGSFGCGKTYLISAMMNELAKENIKSAIVFWPEFLRDLKASFQTGFKEKIETMKRVPLLLIDDIGAETTTTWGRDEILGPILQYRMDEKLPTFFTSNLDLIALEQHFSISKDQIETVKARRIIERIKQLTDYQEMISENLRK